MHHVRVMLGGEDIPRTPHVGGKLIDLVEPSVEHGTAYRGVAQVADDELVSCRFRELGMLDVHTPNEQPFRSQSPRQVASDEPACTAHQSSFHRLFSAAGARTRMRPK